MSLEELKAAAMKALDANRADVTRFTRRVSMPPEQVLALIAVAEAAKAYRFDDRAVVALDEALTKLDEVLNP